MSQRRRNAGDEQCIATALQQATQALRAAGCEEPRLDAELLLAEVLRHDRCFLYAHGEQPLTPAEQTAFDAFVRRRAKREPLAYIVGHREFYGRDFLVDERALIPRPETELLVELVLAHARARPATPFFVADVGTGSGIIAITLAKELPTVVVYGLDVSSAALALATLNSKRWGTQERVILRQGDLLTPLDRHVHCMVANLPYIAPEEWAALSPEIREFEPKLALAGGMHGLELIQRLLRQAGSHLLPGGAIFLEIGAPQGAAALALVAQSFRCARVALHQDFGGWDRVLEIHVDPAQAGAIAASQV